MCTALVLASKDKKNVVARTVEFGYDLGFRVGY